MAALAEAQEGIAGTPGKGSIPRDNLKFQFTDHAIQWRPNG